MNSRSRTYVHRDILIDEAIAQSGTVVAIIDFKALKMSDVNVTARITQAATHATTTGVAVTGVWGSHDEAGEQVFDTSTTPEAFGTAALPTNQTEEQVGVLQFTPDLAKGSLLKLTFTNTDVTNPGALDAWLTS